MQMRRLRQTLRHFALQSLTSGLKEKIPFFAKKANFSYSKRMEFAQRPFSPAKIPLKKRERIFLEFAWLDS